MNYLIGTDIGTSGTKSIVMDTNGALLASSLAEYGVTTPRRSGPSSGRRCGWRR